MEFPTFIRPATVEDIPQILPMVAKICQLHQQWDRAKYGFLPNPEQRYPQWLNRIIHRKRDLLLVADYDGKIAGFLVATVEREVPIYELQEYAFIHDLWVEEQYRKLGLAKGLVKGAIAHFQSLGVSQIRLDTATPNETARQLFQACGFRPSTVEMLIELEP